MIVDSSRLVGWLDLSVNWWSVGSMSAFIKVRRVNSHNGDIRDDSIVNAARWKLQPLSAVSCARTAEPIEMPFGIWTRVGPRKHVLGGCAHLRNLANTTEPSMCGSDTTFRQITLTTVIYVIRT